MDFSKLFDLTGKNAMVVGGAGGLGKLVAEAFAVAGAKVCIASRTEEKLKAACEELAAKTGKEFKYYVMDAGVEEQVEAVAKQANADFGLHEQQVHGPGRRRAPQLERLLPLRRDHPERG